MFEVAAALSLALCLGLVGLWIYSHHRPILHMRVGASGDRVWRFFAVDGSIALERAIFYKADDARPWPPYDDDLDPKLVLYDYRRTAAALLNGNFFLGPPAFLFCYSGSGPNDRFGRGCCHDLAQIRLGVLVELAAILPTIWVGLFWQRRRRCPAGQCVPAKSAGGALICLVCGRRLPHVRGRIRHLFWQIAMFTSVMLSLIVAQLWLRSQWVCECYDWNSSKSWLKLSSYHGQLRLSHEPGGLYPMHITYSTCQPFSAPRWVAVEDEDLYWFGWRHFYGRRRSFYFPYWVAFLPTTILPLVGLASAWRRARNGRRIVWRFAHGLCWNCGYDLRATPERCPECGLEPPRKMAEICRGGAPDKSGG